MDNERENVADNVLQALGTLTAWFVAAGQIFTKKALHKEISLARIHYPTFNAYRYDPKFTTSNLTKLFPNFDFPPQKVNHLLEMTKYAKIHAEAALMAWAYGESKKDVPGLVGLILLGDLPINSMSSSKRT